MRLPLLFLALVSLSAPAGAQSGLMPYAGYNTGDEAFVVGAGVRFALPLRAPVTVVAQPAVEYQFISKGVDVVQTDLNVAVELVSSAVVTPYAGSGLGVTHAYSGRQHRTEVGLNVVGGLVFNPSGYGRPFLQGRYATRGAFLRAFTVQGGIILGL